jgi:conjugative transfer signal peptidase TraF
MTHGLFASTRGSRAPTAMRIAVGCVCLVVAIFQLWGSLGLRINTSPSLPVGLYITTSDPAAHFVEFCPTGPLARLAIVRGYRDVGNCPDGAAPLLKPAIARFGDVVDVSQRGIAVNGSLLPNTAPVSIDTKGRPLMAWPSGRYIVEAETIWVASSFHPRSFDSRYFGPLPTGAVRGYVRPLITGGK